MERPMKTLQLIVIGCLVWGVNCSEKQDSEVMEQPATDFELADVVTAKDNIETVCVVCHSPSADPDDRLAPPLEIVKRNYLAETSSKEEFTTKMVDFILRPTAEQSMLHSDVEEYGLMDPVGFSEADIRAIVEFIYENDLEKPDWLIDN